jgi:Zn-finger nucleic acid-binding protein
VIVDCPGCSKLYSLEDYEHGERLRCRCGQIIVVHEAHQVRTHTARAIHCATCGGMLEPGKAECPFCDALVDQTSARMNEFCSSCYAMSPEGAAYCSGCGRPLVTVLDAPTRTDRPCPRCKVPMRRRELAGHRPLECPMCCGLFVEPDDFETLMRAQAEHEDRAEPIRGPERALVDLDADEKLYVPCPGCGEMMNRANYADESGVIVDYCREHGYWLDPGELEKIARWIKSGGTVRKYAVDSDALRRGSDSIRARPTPAPAQQRESRSSPTTSPGRQTAADGDFLDGFLTFILGRR